MEKAPPPPLLGFNNNVRYLGRVFHIQTEDSGIKHARIVTHLFADGGRIVKSTRTEYSEHIGQPDMVEVLRRIMKEQHKAMFIRLRAGELDPFIEAACGPLRGRPAKPVPPEPAVPPPPPAPPAVASESLDTRSEPLASGQSPDKPPLPPRRRHLSNPNLRRSAPSLAPPTGEIELDEELLRGNDPGAKPRTSPPKSNDSEPSAGHVAPSAPSAEPLDPTQPAEQDERYSSPRPPNIFEAPLTEHSLFGEQRIREKSLDEVILSYLAEDLDEGPEKP